MLALLTPGFDPTTLAAVTGACGDAVEISAADLLVLVANATPLAPATWIWYSNAQPDILTTPAFANFIWLNPDNSEWRRYDGVAWVLLGYAVQSINGSAIINGTLHENALRIVPGSAGQILQVNSLETSWQLILPQNAIANGAMPISRLTPGPAATWLFSDGTTLSWQQIGLGYILTQLGVGHLPVDALQIGTDGFALQMVAGLPEWAALPPAPGLTVTAPDAGKFLTNNGTIVLWATLPVPSFTVSALNPGTNGDVLQTVGGLATWRPLAAVLGQAVSPLLTLPAVWNTWSGSPPWLPDVTWAHGLGVRPVDASANFVCRVSYGPYTAAKSTVPVSQSTRIGSEAQTTYMVEWDDVNVYLKRTNDDGALLKGGAAYLETGVQALTNNWDVQFIVRS